MSRPIQCLIVDDEPSAQEILKQYVEDAPKLILTGYCDDALEAMEFLSDNQVDLLFLDINMPKLSGISFLKSLNHPPAVILTTAYEEYALEGYELDIIDYLLKPFSFERFIKAISKAESRIYKPNKVQSYLTIKADKKNYRIPFHEILFIKSKGDYVTLYTSNKKLTAYETLKNLEEQLASNQFLRVHKSFIISLKHIEYLEGNSLKVGDELIPIGTTYQEEVKSRILNR